ncbi:HK97 family phage portal protein [Comamonas odontotermitis]|uniref:HK97 family phage portal protein n=1 Tax=Comamonas odontotermitis TaxID=379895 RepID=A0ABR6RFR6_9BURK|nr:phage portal protein [Comamonas odontotermitis]MBB6578000.1 HK97 family phage portal protein [Comamonas odontotermitis]
MKNPMRTALGRVRATVLGWLLPSGGGGAGTVIHVSGAVLTDQKLLRLSTVWACTRLISETIATLPLGMNERTATGKRAAPDHWLHRIIHAQPNADSTASVFWEAVVAAMLLRDGANAEKLMIGPRIVGLKFLAPNRLTLTRRSDGSKEYRYTEENGTQRIIPNDRIWHIPGFSLDGKNGVSVIEYGAQVFGNALAADEAAGKTFKTGLLQTLYYKVEKWLTPEQRQEFKKEYVGSVERGEVPVLEGGIDVGAVGINPADAQLLESRGFSVEEICRWFRVPPWMVGHTEKSTSWGTGIEQQMIGFLTFTLGPWLRRIEQSIVKDLLSPAERQRYYPKFAVEGLLRADTAGRAAFYAAMVNNGILTRDEVRELEDREPMGGNAAVLTVQSAMTTLDSIGTATELQQVRAAMRNLLGFEDDSKG